LIGADGSGSTVRQQLLPDVTAHYAGYVAWRGLVGEADVPEEAAAILCERCPGITSLSAETAVSVEFRECLAGEAVSGEPVSGEDSLRSGKRTGNFVKIGPFGKKPPVRT
jgi:2-polyprenyl-6-methoxyphenol hydroxylase-like FAD-dependent oxidoreductase